MKKPKARTIASLKKELRPSKGFDLIGELSRLQLESKSIGKDVSIRSAVDSPPLSKEPILLVKGKGPGKGKKPVPAKASELDVASRDIPKTDVSSVDVSNGLKNRIREGSEMPVGKRELYAHSLREMEKLKTVASSIEFDSYIFDKLGPFLANPTDLAMYLYLYRRTIGDQKPSIQISSNLWKHILGVSKNTARGGIKRLNEHQLIRTSGSETETPMHEVLTPWRNRR